MKRKLTAAALVTLVAVLLALFVTPGYRQGEPSLRGRTAKDFPFTLDGKQTRLSDLRGKVVLLNFWATWCPPCVEEAQGLNELQTRISSKGGTVLGVSVDDDQAAYEDFLKAHLIGFPTYRDVSKQIPLTYGTTMYPETYVIDRKGRLDRKIVGPQDWTSPEMLAYLNSLLQEN